MIGLCINYNNHNYGGLLQAYATTIVLDKLNLEYEIIRYKKKESMFAIIKSIPRLLNIVLINDKKENLLKKIGLLLHKDFRRNNDIREQKFDYFIKSKFKKLSPVFVGYDNLCCQAKQRYSCVISGSDQLWSPAGLPTNFYNLMFCDKQALKISYASSFGVSYIPWYQKSRTKAYLEKIDFISMRESKGADLVYQLTNRVVPVVLDPVFLLSYDEWNALIPTPKKIMEKYVFVYFLGKAEHYIDSINKFAKCNNLKIVVLKHLDQYDKKIDSFGDYSPYDVDPEDFLNIIKNAEYIFTDSFHGSAFSILFKKQFLTFNRYSSNSKASKNSRVDTLLKTFDILDRRYNGNINFVKEDINYETINGILKTRQKESFDFLSKSLNKKSLI